MVIDLHTHSTVSDGSDRPARVIELAAEAGCSAVALTDHDALAGLPAAAERAAQLGIELVPGCEVSVKPPATGGMHVLVYFVDDPASPLGVELDLLRSDRARRNRSLVIRLADLGFPIAYDDVVAAAGSEAGVGRPHFARVLVASGAVSSVQEAFDRLLANGAPAYVPKTRIEAAQVAELAIASGGVAVLAHPLSLGLENEELERLVAGLAEAGFGGLEAIYSRYRPDQRAGLVELARRHGLVATGGSDHHGTFKPDLTVGTGAGDLRVPDRVLDELRERRPAA